MQTTQAKIIHWLRSAVVLSVAVTPLAAASPDSGSASSTAASDPAATLLWYQQPAVKWEEALPVGNGRLGAMVFGGTAEKRLQSNESTLWAGCRTITPTPMLANIWQNCAAFFSPAKSLKRKSSARGCWAVPWVNGPISHWATCACQP